MGIIPSTSEFLFRLLYQQDQMAEDRALDVTNIMTGILTWVQSSVILLTDDQPINSNAYDWTTARLGSKRILGK